MPDDLPPQALTANLAVHPSPMVPGIPSFVFSVPKGWVIDEAPAALCVVRHPEADATGFWVNALLSHSKVARTVDFEAAAKATWASQKTSTPSARDNGERLVRFGSRVVYTRGVELDGPDGRPLAQLQAMFFAPVTEAGKVVDFFQIVGTCPRDEAINDNVKAFMHIVASFRFV